MPDDKEPSSEPVEVKLTFRVHPRMPAVYAHHIIVQPGEQEVLLSFFEVIPPPIINQDEETLKKLLEAGVVADCVARVIVAKGRFPGFVRALQDILKLDGSPEVSAEEARADAIDTRDNPEGS